MKSGIFPTKRTVLLFCIPFGLIILSLVASWLRMAAILYNCIVVIILLIDISLLPDFKKKVLLDIKPPKYFKIYKPASFYITVINKNNVIVNFSICFDFDISVSREYMRQNISCDPRTQKTVSLTITAKRRGEFVSNSIFIKAHSLLGLLSYYRTYSSTVSIMVIPSTYIHNKNFRFMQREIKQREGLQRNKLIGNGINFEMLKDYEKSDAFSRIDWKATARRRRPVTRVYRFENNFELAIMLDCGRIMSTEIYGKSLLDYAVDAANLLSYSALRGNDNVSLTAFADKIIHYIPPVRSLKNFKKISLSLTNLQYHFVECNYHTAFSFVRSKLSKRSLIVIFTDILDDSNIREFHKIFTQMQKKHLVLLILLRDKNLFLTANSGKITEESIYMKAAACDLVLKRNKTIFDLKRLGIHILDLYPEKANTIVLNKYIELKNRN